MPFVLTHGFESIPIDLFRIPTPFVTIVTIVVFLMHCGLSALYTIKAKVIK